jgi:hypothetical protein
VEVRGLEAQELFASSHWFRFAGVRSVPLTSFCKTS